MTSPPHKPLIWAHGLVTALMAALALGGIAGLAFVRRRRLALPAIVLTVAWLAGLATVAFELAGYADTALSVYLLLGALFWSSGGFFIKESNAGAVSITFFRCAFSALLLAPLIRGRRLPRVWHI